MMAMVSCAPDKLRLIIVEMQAIGLHPLGDSGDAVGRPNCRQEHVNV